MQPKALAQRNVKVLQRTLFCSLNLLFDDVLVAVIIVVCLSSLLFIVVVGVVVEVVVLSSSSLLTSPGSTSVLRTWLETVNTSNH